MTEFSQSNARLTFTQNQTPQKQIYKEVFKIAFRSFGNQRTQLNRFHTKFVRDNKWLSQSQFREIVSLCWALPGPTTIQFLVTMITLKTFSLQAGLISFVLFSIPSWLMLSILGFLSSVYLKDYDALSPEVKLLILGFNSASAGIIVESFLQNFKQHYHSIPKIIITFSSAAIFFSFQSVGSISFCLVVGAIISLYLPFDNKKKMSSKSQALMSNANFSWFLGKNSLRLLIALFFILWLWTAFYPNNQFFYIFIFYFSGCFIIGPVNTIFAYVLGNFLHQGYMTEHQIWLGIPFAFLAPGSILNVGIYFGSLLDGIKGALLAGLMVYLPCFLSLYGILPKWRYYRNKAGIQRMIDGVTCVTTGFILAVVNVFYNQIIGSLAHSIRTDLSIALCIFSLSIFMTFVGGVPTTMNILLAGLLANTRRWGLIYYRMLPDKIY